MRKKSEGKEHSNDNNRFSMTYIILVLKNHTDKEHPMTVPDIQKKLKEEFEHEISKDTVLRMMTCLTANGLFSRYVDPFSSYEGADSINDKHHIGFFIRNVGTERYGRYYYESLFQEKELLVLKDAVETQNFLAPEDVTNLINKLKGLRPRSMEHLEYMPNKTDQLIKDGNSILLNNVKTLADLIGKGYSCSIEYSNYNEDFDLVPREGYPRIIRPIEMLSMNGYYYCLLIYPEYREKKDLAVLRIDRITDILPVEPSDKMSVELGDALLKDLKEEILNRFGPKHSRSDYSRKHYIGFGGPAVHAELLLRIGKENPFMNVVVDEFGRDTEHKVLSEEDVKKELGYLPTPKYTDEKWVKIRGENTRGGILQFVAQHCQDVTILAPVDLKKDLIQKLRSALCVNGDGSF